MLTHDISGAVCLESDESKWDQDWGGCSGKKGESQRFNNILGNLEQFKEATKAVNTRKKVASRNSRIKQNNTESNKTVNLYTKGNAIVVHYWLYNIQYLYSHNNITIDILYTKNAEGHIMLYSTEQKFHYSH